MAVFFLLLYTPIFVLSWLLLNGSFKLLLKEKYKKHYAVICFLLLAPLIFVLLGFVAVSVMPFPAD